MAIVDETNYIMDLIIHTSNIVQVIIFHKFHGPILTLFGYFAALSYIYSNKCM